MGHASPQPVVITTSAAWTSSSDNGFGSSRLMSMPTSLMASTTRGLSDRAGSLPAERTRTRPPACRSRRAAAIWLLPALCTQTNRTSGTSAFTPSRLPADHEPACKRGDRRSLLMTSEHEVEGRSLADDALGPGPSTMAVDDSAHGGEADAASRKFALAVQALERAEQLVRVDHVEAHPVVADEHPSATVHDLGPDHDSRRR